MSGLCQCPSYFSVLIMSVFVLCQCPDYNSVRIMSVFGSCRCSDNVSVRIMSVFRLCFTVLCLCPRYVLSGLCLSGLCLYGLCLCWLCLCGLCLSDLCPSELCLCRSCQRFLSARFKCLFSFQSELLLCIAQSVLHQDQHSGQEENSTCCKDQEHAQNIKRLQQSRMLGRD